MKNKRIFFLFCVTIILYCLSFGLSANTSTEIEVIKEILNEKDGEIAQWNFIANILVGLTVLVGVLGALATILQKCKKHWCAVCTAIAGAAISLITVATNTAFSTDYRTLRLSSEDAKYLINEIRLLLPLREDMLKGEDIKNWRFEIRNRLEEITKISTRLVSSDADFEFISSAFAESGNAPSWIHQPPRDDKNYYVVGSGKGLSIGEAKLASTETATKITQAYLTQLLAIAQAQGMSAEDINIKELSEYLSRSLQVASTYISFDSKNNVYLYYTLYKINRDVLGIDMRLYSAQKGTLISPKVRNFIQSQVQQ